MKHIFIIFFFGIINIYIFTYIFSQALSVSTENALSFFFGDGGPCKSGKKIDADCPQPKEESRPDADVSHVS